MPDHMSDIMSDPMSDTMSYPMSDTMSDTMSDPMSDTISDNMADPMTNPITVLTVPMIVMTVQNYQSSFAIWRCFCVVLYIVVHSRRVFATVKFCDNPIQNLLCARLCPLPKEHLGHAFSWRDNSHLPSWHVEKVTGPAITGEERSHSGVIARQRTGHG